METLRLCRNRRILRQAFSIISPQGDGNSGGSEHDFVLELQFLFQSFPRKGMETSWVFLFLIPSKLFQSFPRKGMETVCVGGLVSTPISHFFNHFPARGWKPFDYLERAFQVERPPFSIISPQGDGNSGLALITSSEAFSIISPQGDGNDAHQNRNALFFASYFFNHFPARGWKQLGE